MLRKRQYVFIHVHVLHTYVRTLVVAVWAVSMTCIYRFSPANSLTSFVLLSFCQCALCETEIKTYCFVISYTRNALELLINALSHDERTLARCSRCRPIRRMTTPYDCRSTYSWVVNSAADPDHLQIKSCDQRIELSHLYSKTEKHTARHFVCLFKA